MTNLEYIFLFAEKHNFPKSDCEVVFNAVDDGSGKDIYTTDADILEVRFDKNLVENEIRRLTLEKDKVDRRIVPFKDLLKDISQNIGKIDEYYDNIRNGNSKANRNFLKDTRVFMADKTIDSYYRFEFSNLYIIRP